MSIMYDLTIQKEVLSELSAYILGDLSRYIIQNDLSEDHPLVTILNEVEGTKQNILVADSEQELLLIKGQLLFAKKCTSQWVN